MTKLTVNKEIADIRWELDGKSIDEAIEYLKEAKEEYGSDWNNIRFDISVETEYYGENARAVVSLMGDRLETDEEERKRELAERLKREADERRERKVYKALRKKYAN